MCHSCASRNLGLFLRKQEPRKHGFLLLSGFLIAQERHFLDCRFRGIDTPSRFRFALETASRRPGERRITSFG